MARDVVSMDSVEKNHLVPPGHVYTPDISRPTNKFKKCRHSHVPRKFLLSRIIAILLFPLPAHSKRMEFLCIP